jgi:hypothetical protein
MIDLSLIKVSETNRLITFSWTPVPCAGYVFYVDNTRVSNSWDPFKSSIRFNKVPDAVYKVEAVEVNARGTYPSTSVPDSEDYSEEPYGVGAYSK